MINFIEINNYRSCINTKFDLNSNISALIGVNGVGKSNILYSLRLFGKTTRSRIFFIDDEHKDELLQTQINLSLLVEDKIVYVRSKFYYSTDERNIDEVSFMEIKYRVEGENPRKWITVDADMVEYLTYARKRRILEYPKRFQSESSRLSLKISRILSNISYYSATQFSDPSKCPISIDLDDFKRVSTLSGTHTHQKFIYDLYNASTRKKDSPAFELFINTVGSAGLNLIENIEFHIHEIPSSSYKVKTGGKIQKIENLKQIIVPSIKIDGLNLSPNQLSEGTFKTLALVFYILNDNNEILLIEEPEVCVHHGLLCSIVELIKHQSLKKQIIISTHSDYLLDMLLPENILLVKKENFKGTIASPLSKILSKNEYKILKEYLQSSGNLGEYWKEGGFDND